MKIVVVGGGSGGHVTPVVAVIEEIWKIKPRAEVEFWTDKKYFENVSKLTAGMGPRIRARRVSAGKFRRYAHFKFIDYLKNFNVVLLNIADMLRFLVGGAQSFSRLVRLKPDVIFIKGGYVGLPVGLMAGILKIPYVIHDSDAVPGLTNRILAKKATKIATGMPLEYYKYPVDKSEWTGIPVASEFAKVGSGEQKKLKRELGFDAEKMLVVATGGSLGAMNINQAMGEILPELLGASGVMLVAGREGYPKMMELKEYEKWEDGKLISNFRMVEFSSDMAKLFGAADVVVSRAGASTIAELASMKKAVVMVPNAMLPGKHQVHNAEALGKEGAVLIVEDTQMVKKPELLLAAVGKLLRSKKSREEQAGKLYNFAKGDAAKKLADMVVESA